MARLTKKRSRKAGLPPGTLIHIGDQSGEQIRMTVLEYDENRFHEQRLDSVSATVKFRDDPAVTWLNVDGLAPVDTLKSLGDVFSLHPLVMEDIVNTDQRAKVEDFDSYLYIVLRMLTYEEGKGTVQSEQLSLILGPRFVLSFQEKAGDIFDPVRERLRNNRGRIRKLGPDYLTYCLIDAVVDNYFTILEKVGERIEDLEEDILENPTPEGMHEIHRLKREMITLRKAVWPLREMLGILDRTENDLVDKTTRVFLRDVYDHTIQIMDTVETFRDILAGLLDLYLSTVSNRMNEVMKVLTIIATIFIPLTFIVGIYGMNFPYMPETEWHYGYFMILGLMGVMALIMLTYFKRKKWL